MNMFSEYEKLTRQCESENVSPRKAAFSMFCWCLKQLFGGEEQENVEEEKKNIEIDSQERVNVAMVTSGGLGDHLLFANYVFHFKQMFVDETIDVFFKDKFGLASHIFHEHEVINKFYELKDLVENKYDLVLNLAGFPSVESVDVKRIQALNPKLFDYVQMCQEYKKYCRSAFRGNAYGMMKLCELEGRTLLQRGDIYNYLNVNSYQYPLFIDIDETEYLERVNLKPDQYITIQTGIDVIYDSHVKQWPIEHYRQLVKMISHSFPKIKIVQVGNSGDICLEGISNSLNLLKQTNVEEIKILVKNSLLHIDIEGGLVHMRNALKGGISVVLFGPTDIRFFGYEKNVNLKTNFCDDGCYQLTSDWPYRCPKTGMCGYAECMRTLRPEQVFKEIYKLIGK